MRTALKRGLLSLTATGTAGGAALYAVDPDVFHAVNRWRRCVCTTAAMVTDYSWSLWGLEGDRKNSAMTQAHERNAERLRQLLFQNRGLYLKVGQHIGMLDYMVPDEYVSAMRRCYDDTPYSSISDVAAVFQEEFGAPATQVFASFNEVPIASASLAQVHVARTHAGQKVAVKVQHRTLKRMAQGEIAAVDYLLQAVRCVRPDFGMQWLVDEMRLNLPKELDFHEEADNADRCRDLCRPFGKQVVVPRVHRELTTTRVLTMDFEEGCALWDARTIQDQGMQTRSVVRLLSEVFAEMVFCRGFVHCDPHPGNVLIRRLKGTNKAQLVLLDHGLYREIPDALRIQYCQLWKGIVLGDLDGIKEASKALGIRSPWMEKSFPGLDVTHTMIAAMLTAKEWQQIADPRGGLDRFDSKETKDAEKAKLSNNVAEYMQGIFDVLETCPRGLLLLLKTNDSLRSAAGRLGGRSTDTFIVTAKACIRALRHQRAGDTWWQESRNQLGLLRAYSHCLAFQRMEDMKDLLLPGRAAKFPV